MSEPQYLFILGGEKPLMLHPFESGSGLFETPGPIMLSGRYGTGEMPKDTVTIRANLYKAMEQGSRRHFLDKGYYTRLFLTVFSFLGIYLFFSLVIRDPVPMIDELLLGGLAAAAVFFASERKALSSPKHIESMLSLRRSIDASMFIESRVVDLVESWRDEALELGPASFYREDATDPELSPDERAEAEALCTMFANRWRSRPIVAELYDASHKGTPPGKILDKMFKTMGPDEAALAIAYLRLLACIVTVAQ
ncbi:MAG: hypothetical protein AB7T74_01245 [Clostridia bacterium]|jgi:hypothetical protein|nr:hypothetical protein [Spirochaetia bacterium]